MKPVQLLAMSLLALLFGCHSKKSPAAAQAWPRFPATDQPASAFTWVKLDEGFVVKAFYLAPDRQQVYVLAYRDTVRQEGEYEVNATDGRLYALDSEGRPLRHLDLPDSDWIRGASFGRLDGQLLVQLQGCFQVLDPEKFALGEQIPVNDSYSFPSRKDIVMMTYNERQDAYEEAFNALLNRNNVHCQWLEWTPSGEYFVWARDAKGRRTAWSPLSYRDEDIEPLKARFAALYPDFPPPGEVGPDLEPVDGPVRIREAELLAAGTELDYPNYKERHFLQYELIRGDKTLRFSTTDKKRHDLRLEFADNGLLTTADGAVWVKYESVLYRME